MSIHTCELFEYMGESARLLKVLAPGAGPWLLPWASLRREAARNIGGRGVPCKSYLLGYPLHSLY